MKVNNLVLWQVLTIVFLLIAEEKCVEICLENKSSSWVCDSFLESFPSPDLASFAFNSVGPFQKCYWWPETTINQENMQENEIITEVDQCSTK